jgi:hypothetical protein
MASVSRPLWRRVILQRTGAPVQHHGGPQGAASSSSPAPGGGQLSSRIGYFRVVGPVNVNVNPPPRPAPQAVPDPPAPPLGSPDEPPSPEVSPTIDYTVRWSSFDRRYPKMGVFLQSTEATPCGHHLK